MFRIIKIFLQMSSEKRSPSSLLFIVVELIAHTYKEMQDLNMCPNSKIKSLTKIASKLFLDLDMS